ncbi:MAG: carboxylating nicotinate-nucleotide diphosphorylase [Alphaproteobacteria bacterium]
MIEKRPLEFSFEKIIKDALYEDLGQQGDITSNSVIDKNLENNFVLKSRSEGVISGLQVAELSFMTLDSRLSFEKKVDNGSNIKNGDIIASVKGNAASILSAERTALNFLSHLSGIASATSEMANLISETNTKIVSTRKTTPNLRILEKFAVKDGGGMNHRFGLYDGILIKDNHLALSGSITNSVSLAREKCGHMINIEVEVDNLDQYREALETQTNAILLDNFNIEDLIKAVNLNKKNIILEASGKITKDNILEIAKTGVNLISSGWLTHSSPSLDIGLDFS